MSPFCPGLTLAACPSSAATALRDEIRRRAEAGESLDRIRTDLIARFGSAISGEPPFAGPGLLLWFSPLAIAGGVGFALAGLMRRSVARDHDESAHSIDPDERDQLMLRIDDELRDLD